MDFFSFFVILWLTFSSPLWLSFLLAVLVLFLALNLSSLVNWLTFMMILLWIGGLLILIIHVSTIGLFLSSMPSLVLLFLIFLNSKIVFYTGWVGFVSSFTFMLGTYIFIFFLLFMICLFLIHVFENFCKGPFRSN